MSALAVSFPSTIRPNAYWREHHPQMVEAAQEHALAQLWAPQGEPSRFDEAMRPYAADPFRGARERRVLAPGQTAVELEAQAVRDALWAFGGGVGDIDMMIVCSMRPDTIAVGDAAWLARHIGMRCPAINLETACASSITALELACSLVESGRHRRILVVTSCTYSRDIDETSSLSWFLGDGAGAFIVEAGPAVAVPIGVHAISTAATCGAFVHELVVEEGTPRMKMRATKGAGAILHDTAEPYLRTCCHGALEAAGVRPADVSLFVFNTPTAWYAEFGAKVLGVDPQRTVSTYPIYTNVGPALMPVNLHHAARQGRLQPGDVVLAYAVGSASTAMATVMVWGQVALGPDPAPPSSASLADSGAGDATSTD